jgi:hypothetical protein
VVSEKSNKSLVSDETNFQTVGSTGNFVKTIENISLFLQPIKIFLCPLMSVNIGFQQSQTLLQ